MDPEAHREAHPAERRKRKKSDYAWIATIITALGTSIGGIVKQVQHGNEMDKVSKSAYVATSTQLALIEYRLSQLEARMQRREERAAAPSGFGHGVAGGAVVAAPAPMPIIPMPASAPMPASLPSFEELQQHVKKTGEAFKQVLVK